MGLFSREEIKPKYLEEPEWQRKAREKVQGQVGKWTAPSTRYGMSDVEKMVDPLLASYAGRGRPSLWDPIKTELQTTLTGGYDPTTSPFYAPAEKELAAKREAGKTRSTQAAGMYGMGRSTPLLGMKEREETKYASDLSNLLYGMTERERAKKFSAIDPAMRFSREEEDAPLRGAQAIRSYGDLKRVIDQLRTVDEKYGSQLAMTLLSGYKPTAYMPQYGESKFEKYGKPIGSVIGTMIGAAMGNPAAGSGMGGGMGSAGGTDFTKYLSGKTPTSQYKLKLPANY